MSLFPQGDPVEEARLLLPWYITGKLDKAEREFVERMLAQHPSLQAEYHDELTMVNLIRNNASLLQLSTMDSTAQRFEKLMKRIERETAPVAPATITPPKPASTKPSWINYLRQWIPRATWLTPANAVFATFLVIQVALLGWFNQSLQQVNPEGTYVSAAVSETPPTVAATDEMTLLVEFRDNVQIHQLRQFLQQWNARIVESPENDDFFRLRVRGVSKADQRSDAILEQMQQHQNLIAFIGREY